MRPPTWAYRKWANDKPSLPIPRTWQPPRWWRYDKLLSKPDRLIFRAVSPFLVRTIDLAQRYVPRARFLLAEQVDNLLLGGSLAETEVERFTVLTERYEVLTG